MQTRRLVASFEALNSYLAQLPDGLWSCTVAWKQLLMQDFKVRIQRSLAANMIRHVILTLY